MTVILGVVALMSWLLCGFVGSGICYAFLQRNFQLSADEDRGRDASFSVFMSVFGPIFMAVVFFDVSFCPFRMDVSWKPAEGKSGLS